MMVPANLRWSRVSIDTWRPSSIHWLTLLRIFSTCFSSAVPAQTDCPARANINTNTIRFFTAASSHGPLCMGAAWLDNSPAIKQEATSPPLHLKQLKTIAKGKAGRLVSVPQKFTLAAEGGCGPQVI